MEIKIKGTFDKRDFKLTVSRALNVEEIELNKSLASVKRARLKEKKNKPENDEKEFKSYQGSENT